MSFTSDWSNAAPVDHSKFKDIPGSVRDVRVDLEERLADIIYGFTSGETDVYLGLKKARLITIGTAAGTTPPGTGAATSIDVYARANGTDSSVELWAVDSDGNDVQLTKDGKIPLDVSGRLANDAYLIARNYAADDNVNILKVNTADAAEMASHLYAPDTAPSADLQYAPKGYVDNKFPVNIATPGTGITGVLPVANGGTGQSYMQAGSVSIGGSTTAQVTLSPAFPDTDYAVLLTYYKTDGAPGANVLYVSAKATSSFTITNQNAVAAYVDYLAIAY